MDAVHLGQQYCISDGLGFQTCGSVLCNSGTKVISADCEKQKSIIIRCHATEVLPELT